jgi:hypothetical protein
MASPDLSPKPVVQIDAIGFSPDDEGVKLIMRTWSFETHGKKPQDFDHLSKAQYDKECGELAGSLMRHVGRDPERHMDQWRAAKDQLVSMRLFHADSWFANPMRAIRDRAKDINRMAIRAGVDFCLPWTDICVLMGLKARGIQGRGRDLISVAIQEHHLLERAAASIDAHAQHRSHCFEIVCLDGLSFHSTPAGIDEI